MKKLTLIVLAVLMSACSTQVYKLNPAYAPGTRTEITHHFFVSGIGQTKTVNAAEVCGGADKVTEVEARQSFVNGLLGVLTFGIYTPRSAAVTCVT